MQTDRTTLTGDGLYRARDWVIPVRYFRRLAPFRWLRILALLPLAGCIMIPLPDEGPKPAKLQLPPAGTTRSAVADTLKMEPAFDLGRIQVYSWATDRNFVMTAYYALPEVMETVLPSDGGHPYGLVKNEAVHFDLAGGILDRVPVDGLLSFGARGIEESRPVHFAGDRIALRLQVPGFANPDVVALFHRDGRALAILDGRNDYARAAASFGFGISPDGTRLAVLKPSHLEIWHCPDLVAWMRDPATPRIPPTPRTVFLFPFTNSGDSWKSSHAPIAFSADGRLLAAGGPTAVAVWDVEAGRLLSIAGPVPLGFPNYRNEMTTRFDETALVVQALAIDPAGLLTAALFDHRQDIVIARWRTPSLPVP